MYPLSTPFSWMKVKPSHSSLAIEILLKPRFLYSFLHQRSYKSRYITSLVSNSYPLNRFCHTYALQSHTRAPPQSFLFRCEHRLSPLERPTRTSVPLRLTLSPSMTRAPGSRNGYVLTPTSTCWSLKTSTVRWLNAINFQ